MLTVASAALPADPASVPVARDMVGAAAGQLPRRVREAAELITSELATNSVLHARTPFEVFAAVDEEAVEVLVADGAGWRPRTEQSDHSGQGLLLVGLLASEWTAVLENGGKRVWVRLECDDVPAC
jgi:anti-sigma regulatory factor (Ser/Thr protein kinase)